MNIYDFSDQLNSDREMRKNFVAEYIEHLKDVTDVEDIIAEWTQMNYDRLLSEIKSDGADNLLEEIAHYSPDWLETQFKVDPSLAQI